MSYKAARERNRRLKKLGKKTENSYGAGAWYNEKKGRYIKYSCHRKSLKEQCRRTTRRRMKNMDDLIARGGYYKKIFDYWWELL
jgi:hypothetical protein